MLRSVENLNKFVIENNTSRNINEFEFQVVGKGAFGTVYKAMWRNNFVAVKYIELETERNAFGVEVNNNRIKIMRNHK